MMRPEDFFEEGKLYRFTERWLEENEESDFTIFRNRYMSAIPVPTDVTLMFLHLYDRKLVSTLGYKVYAWFLVGDQILGCMVPQVWAVNEMFERAK